MLIKPVCCSGNHELLHSHTIDQLPYESIYNTQHYNPNSEQSSCGGDY